MMLHFQCVPNADRTDPADMSRPWGRLTAKMNAGTSIVEVALWPDGAHILKVPDRRTNMGATVTAAQLAELARLVKSVAEGCAAHDRFVLASRQSYVAYEREEDAAAAALAVLGPVFPGAGEPFADWEDKA